MDGAVFRRDHPVYETRDYVKKVLWNATWYSSLFTGKAQSLKAAIGADLAANRKADDARQRRCTAR